MAALCSQGHLSCTLFYLRVVGGCAPAQNRKMTASRALLQDKQYFHDDEETHKTEFWEEFSIPGSLQCACICSPAHLGVERVYVPSMCCVLFCSVSARNTKWGFKLLLYTDIVFTEPLLLCWTESNSPIPAANWLQNQMLYPEEKNISRWIHWCMWS